MSHKALEMYFAQGPTMEEYSETLSDTEDPGQAPMAISDERLFSLLGAFHQDAEAEEENVFEDEDDEEEAFAETTFVEENNSLAALLSVSLPVFGEIGIKEVALFAGVATYFAAPCEMRKTRIAARVAIGAFSAIEAYEFWKTFPNLDRKQTPALLAAVYAGMAAIPNETACEPRNKMIAAGALVGAYAWALKSNQEY